MRTHDELLHYLLDHNLLDHAALLDGDLRVTAIAWRNQTFLVEQAGGPAYVVKQAGAAGGAAGIAREAALYARLSDVADARLQRDVPRLVAHDREAGVLILTALPGAESLRERQARLGRVSPATAVRLGEALAQVHRAGHELRREGWPVEDVPWAFSLHAPSVALARSSSAAGLDFVRLLQRFPEVGQLLESARASWRASTVTHNDVKWDNIVVSAGAGVRLLLVDWELAGWGDPAWDTGSALSEFLACWLLSMPVGADLPAEQLTGLARYPLPTLQPAIAAFWDAYVETMQWDAATAWRELLRAVCFSGARLVQTGFERAQTAERLPAGLTILVQLSVNILQRPQEAAVRLLGLRPGRLAA